MLKNLEFPIFKIENINAISNDDLKNLRKLYTPILGPQAILLYEYLRDLFYSENGNHGFFDFESLTCLLGLDLEALNNARIKLESVSLLNTYIDKFNRKTIFAIERPLDLTAFKKNMILANKLMNLVGKDNFENLIGAHKNMVLSKYEHLLNASANYNDVFDQDEELEAMLKNHEINSRGVETQEINLEIEEKIAFDNFQYKNIYEAILKTDSKFFYSQISSQIPTNSINKLIKESRESGFNDPCINLVFFYAYELNKSINFKYVETIIQDLISKSLTSFNHIEEYLDNVYRKKNKQVICLKDIYKASYFDAIKAPYRN